MKRKFNVLYFGTWGYGKACLEALIECKNVNLVRIFTKWDPEPENPYFNQVFEIANKTGVKTINTLDEKLTKADFENKVLNSGETDIIISCCYDRFFSPSVLNHPKQAAVNIHPSILPEFRGVKPLENALVKGKKEIGVTLHLLSNELDAGDILVQRKSKIEHHQTFGELYLLQCSQIKDCIKIFFEGPEKHIAERIKQNDIEKTFAPRLPFEISDNDTVTEIIKKGREHNLI